MQHLAVLLGMRRKMREAFDDLWIIDLEGDNRGTRQTENIFGPEPIGRRAL